MRPAGFLLLGLAGVGTAGAEQPTPGDTLAPGPVVVGIHLRGRDYEGLRGARVVVLRAAEDTVRFEWRAPTLPEVWTELLGRGHLGFGLPLAAAFAAAAALLMRGPLRRGGRRLLVAGVLLAVLVPWLTGAAVKLWLQAHARPTLPWAMFLDPRALPQLVLLGALFGAPLIWTAWLADRFLRRAPDPARRRRRECAALGAFAATVGAVTLSSVTIFWVFEPMAFMIAPSFWLAWLPVAVAGAGVGWVLGAVPRRPAEASTRRP